MNTTYPKRHSPVMFLSIVLRSWREEDRSSDIFLVAFIWVTSDCSAESLCCIFPFDLSLFYIYYFLCLATVYPSWLGVNLERFKEYSFSTASFTVGLEVCAFYSILNIKSLTKEMYRYRFCVTLRFFILSTGISICNPNPSNLHKLRVLHVIIKLWETSYKGMYGEF